MLKNYLKIAWRNLVKHRVHSFINLTGLSIGLACSLLILLWVQHEYSIDGFHSKGGRLYKVYEREYYSTHIDGNYDTPGPLAEVLKKDFPEVEEAISIKDENHNAVLRAGNKILKVSGSPAGAGFFNMFSFPLLQGTAATALNTPYSIAISRRTALQFFGSPQAAMGKTLRMDDKKDYTVSAVFEDFPDIASRKFNYLINWDGWLEENTWAKGWSSSGPLTFVLLRPDADPAAFDKKLAQLPKKYTPDQTSAYRYEWGLQKFDEVYLHSQFKEGKVAGGRIEYVRLFSIVAVFILLIACVNFMNLATARSVRRAREVGIRKVAGAVRASLVKQFIGESLLLTTLSVAIALVLMALVLPFFNQVTQKQMVLPFHSIAFWSQLGLITLLTSLIAGSYPAFFLSSFKPVKVLKGTIRLTSGAIWIRKGLVVFQFVISIVLVAGTIVVSKQVDFIQHRSLGYERENLVYIRIEGELYPKYRVFKDEASTMPGIQNVSYISDDPTFLDSQTNEVDWEGRDPNTKVSFEHPFAGYDIARTMKLQLKEGREFSREYPTDSINTCLINESAAAAIGYSPAVGRKIKVNGRLLTIIGVLKDFHFRSLHESIYPLILEPGINTYGVILIRTQPGKIKEALSSIESLCHTLNPAFPFNYYFVDEGYQNLYHTEQVISRLSNIFSGLAIFISCLGLLGLVMFSTEQRIKEIGIRKVLGASVISIVRLISVDFLRLVAIAIAIACPLAWWVMNGWLDDYAYKVNLSWWIFALAGILALVITLLTISVQAIRAAMANPALSLKTE